MKFSSLSCFNPSTPEIWPFKVDVQLAIGQHEANNFDNFHDCLIYVCIGIRGDKAALLNDPQVKQVLGVKHQHLGRDEYGLRDLLHLLESLQVPDQAHRQCQVALERADHRVVDRFIQGLE